MATFSAVWLEGLRMMLAGLERPDGTLASPVRGDFSTALQMVALILPAIIPGAAAGGAHPMLAYTLRRAIKLRVAVTAVRESIS